MWKEPHFVHLHPFSPSCFLIFQPPYNLLKPTHSTHINALSEPPHDIHWTGITNFPPKSKGHGNAFQSNSSATPFFLPEIFHPPPSREREKLECLPSPSQKKLSRGKTQEKKPRVKTFSFLFYIVLGWMTTAYRMPLFPPDFPSRTHILLPLHSLSLLPCLSCKRASTFSTVYCIHHLPISKSLSTRYGYIDILRR